MTTPKDIHDFLASRDILTVNISMFHQGHRELYRVVATELRKLTCDGKSTLLVRIFPNIEMHPMRASSDNLPDSLKDALVFQIPSTISFDGKGGAKVSGIFNLDAKTISIEKWLDQSFLNTKITLRDFIRSVSDKEAAHSDKDYNDTLSLAKSIKIIDEDMHKQHIIAIGEYILSIMEETIKKYPEIFGTRA